MKCLERNKMEFYYALFVKSEPGEDEYGNLNGEAVVTYSKPVLIKANISPSNGISQVEQFGKDLKYDKMIVIDDMNCPIDENSVFFIDKKPITADARNLLFDHIVYKIAKSLNSICIAISKVEVS